ILFVAICAAIGITIDGMRNGPSATPPLRETDAAEIVFANPVDELFDGVIHDKIDSVASALRRGADVNATYDDLRTPIMNAAQLGHVKIVELLLSKGADVQARDQRGETPLHSAMFESPPMLGIVEMPQHRSEEDMLRVTELLLAAAASVDAADHAGETPLHRAAGIDGPARLGTLLAAGAQPNVTDSTGRTPLMHAVAAPNGARHLPERIRLLLKHGADVGLQDHAGANALQIAQERLTILSRPEFSRNVAESTEDLRKLLATGRLDPSSEAKIKKRLDELQEGSRSAVESAKENLATAIRLLQEMPTN
ncbi:MAG: ankyrin repeat domain-containing protein, partial [Planctomycetes bacterium]|nr:ankyrin repeat domain-containing protein [Planctomycetota bacterium]